MSIARGPQAIARKPSEMISAASRQAKPSTVISRPTVTLVSKSLAPRIVAPKQPGNVLLTKSTTPIRSLGQGVHGTRPPDSNRMSAALARAAQTGKGHIREPEKTSVQSPLKATVKRPPAVKPTVVVAKPTRAIVTAQMRRPIVTPVKPIVERKQPIVQVKSQVVARGGGLTGARAGCVARGKVAVVPSGGSPSVRGVSNRGRVPIARGSAPIRGGSSSTIVSARGVSSGSLRGGRGGAAAIPQRGPPLAPSYPPMISRSGVPINGSSRRRPPQNRDPFGLDELTAEDLDFIDDDDDDAAEWLRELRSVTKYDPSKYRGAPDIEARESDHRMMAYEEEYSEQIARKEDLEELKKTLELEKRSARTFSESL